VEEVASPYRLLCKMASRCVYVLMGDVL